MMPRNSSPVIDKEILCTYQIKLERVLGVTVSSNAALTCDNNGLIAYPAGCTVVLFNTRTEQQSHIINTCRKTITSLAFSSCGRYIVTGECGHQPAVRIWDLQSDPQSCHPGLAPQPQQVAEFLVHKFGINCVAFSPTGKYVVSVGTQHDMIVSVWDWKNNIKVASNKVSTKVKAIAFAENGSYFVTVGNRHVKFWYLEHGSAKYKDTVPLMGRSAILGDQRNNYFCDVACGRGDSADSTYVITRSGLLCEFNNRRLLDKWVELRTTSANCIAVGEKYIFVGCAEGIVRCFDPSTLRFVTTLPRNHYLGVDVAQGTSIQHMATNPPDAKYPDTVAITYDETNHKLTSVYNDHSIYVWDVLNIQRVGKSFSFLYHSACIWGVEMAPPNSPLPPGSFLTCSSDDTIRVWTLDKLNEDSSKGMYKSNIYSNELLKVVYVDKDLSYIKDLDISGTTEKQENSSYDGRNGVRCITISPDGRHLASGDRAGNIRIHDTSSLRELCKIEAHDAEVLCLEYSDTSLDLMASASRDRLIHVFDPKSGYEFVQTLDDHSSSITAVRFLHHAGTTQMVSCGADKSLIFRSLGEVNGKPQFSRMHNATGKTTLYDMEVDSGQKHVLTACQDRNVRVYSVNTGKHTKSFKGSTGDDGTLIKVALDRSGIYLATSCTDKSLSVYDYYSGECMATVCGHSELATGLRFTPDCRRLVSASGDGCVFVWRVPRDMTVTMHARLSQQAMRKGVGAEMFCDGAAFDFGETGDAGGVDANYRFSIGQLPQWAKKQFTEDASQPSNITKGVAIPKGRWAQRAETAMGVKTFYSSGNGPYPFAPADKRFDSDGGSKDSSLDSGTEVKAYPDSRRVGAVSKGGARVESRRGVMTDDSAIGDVESTAHDADIDSDNEYRHRPIYYPSQSATQSGSEYTVTNIDADELRKSQRKKKAPQILIPPTSTYGSNDSDDDDDEASTPSGENTDRNPMSLLSVSSESLDQLVSRERYLQSTFESMSGVENEVHTPSNKSSISSKFLIKSGERNQEAINAVKQTKNDPEAIRRRQELNRRVADARKRLESVGHSSPLKYSQSIHDLSHIPERDRWPSKPGNAPRGPQTNQTCAPSTYPNPTNSTDSCLGGSVPTDLQLCGCYMRDFHENTSQLSRVLGLNDLIRPRKLRLDRTLAKLHQSLPVSPVSEERSFSDFAARNSFSYFVDSADAEEGLKRVCSDIAKFSEDSSRKYEQISAEKEPPKQEEDGSFSSDSLEDCSLASVESKRGKKIVPPRRCVSNNEIYKYQEETRRSESFYLNPNARSSQESILSDGSCCNSMESLLSNDSECKSAPLEALFQGRAIAHSKSLPKNLCAHGAKSLKTCQTQTDFDLPPKKPLRASEEFQRKLLRFEKNEMHIPSLASKNEQYKSKFRNVLNNKSEPNAEAQQSPPFALSTVNFEKNTNARHARETSSLDRHLFAKSLLSTEEKVCHKPPKPARRHSSRSRRTRTSYEYVRKEEFPDLAAKSNRNRSFSDEHAIEVSFKENVPDSELEEGNSRGLLSDLYDSLDKSSDALFSKNVLQKPRDLEITLEGAKILREIEKRLRRIDELVGIYRQKVASGKVRTLSRVYESMSYYNDLARLQTTPVKFRRRNLSLPAFVERRLNSEGAEVYLDESSPDSSLRRSCSLSDLSVQMPVVPKRKIDQVSGKKTTIPAARSTSRYTKNNAMTRSRSSGVLNQSDSDPETQDKKVSRLMRPTISSHNKINNKTLQNRKKHSYSTSNLNTVGTTDNISTSDEELFTAPPRTKQLGFDSSPPTVTPRKHLNNKEKNRAFRHTIHFDDTITNEDLDSNDSFSSMEISKQLCDDLIDKLTGTAENVVKLYGRLNEGEDNNESHMEKIDKVKMSMIRTHKILHDCIFKDLKQNNGSIDVNQTDTVKKLNDLVLKGANGPNAVINIMEQYSDILLDMVQQKIHSANI